MRSWILKKKIDTSRDSQNTKIIKKNRTFLKKISAFEKRKIIIWIWRLVKMSKKIHSKMHYVDFFFRETNFCLWKYKFNFSTKNFDIGKFNIFLHLRKPLNQKSRKINMGMNIPLKNKSYFAGFPNILYFFFFNLNIIF